MPYKQNRYRVPDENVDGNLRRCLRCREWKDNSTSQYHSANRADGRLHHVCKVCKAVEYRIRRSEVRGEPLEPGVSFSSKSKPYECSTRRKCAMCQEWKLVDMFGRRADLASGLNRRCKSCVASKKQSDSRAKKLLSKVRKRAKEKGVPFSLTLEFVCTLLEKQDICPCCGVEFSLVYDGENRSTYPSIDRLVPHLGYTVENCSLLCFRCNTVKNDAASCELRMVADYIDRELSPTPPAQIDAEQISQIP